MSSVVGNLEREKKRAAIRTQLHPLIRDRQFREDCREFVRALRYLRVRNDELRTLHFISRLRTVLRHTTHTRQTVSRVAMNASRQQRRRRGNRGKQLGRSNKGKRSTPPR